MKSLKTHVTSTKIKCIVLGVLLFVVLLLFGNVLIIGERLQSLHPVIGWIFYLLILLGFGWLILSPLWDYLHLPSFPASVITDSDASPDYRVCQRIARGLVCSEALSFDQQLQLRAALEQKSDLLPLLQEAFQGPVQQALDQTAYRTAQGVFVACAVSQNTQLDALIVLASNIKLIQRLIRLTGYRPSWLKIGKLYLNIFLTALLVEAIEEADLDDFLASFQTTPSIPGLNIAVQSLLHGTGCAFFTLRIGFITQKYLYQSSAHRNSNQIRRQAFQKALPILRKLVTENLTRFPQEVKTWLSRYGF